MFTGWMVSPIKDKFHQLHGYRVVRGYGKQQTIQQEFSTKDFESPELAYEAATDLATLMNNADIII